jgi:hypothetical protein
VIKTALVSGSKLVFLFAPWYLVKHQPVAMVKYKPAAMVKH